MATLCWRVRLSGVSRRSVVWLLTLPLAVVGSQLAHALAYRLVTPNELERTHELAASGHAYMAYVPIALAVGVVLVVVALSGELRFLLRARHAPGSRPSALRFAMLAPAIFVCQEHFERFLHDGVFPVDAGLQPSFLVGLLLQLPFAFAAYLVARLLLRAVRSFRRLFGGRARPRLVRDVAARPMVVLRVPRVAALALGYGSRGPPVPSR
jgi:hypothetical protein